MIILLFLAQIQINAELDIKDISKTLTVGDPFEIVVTVLHPRDVELSEPLVDGLEPFALIHQGSQRVEERGIVRNVYRYRLVAFDTGELRIPAFKCTMRGDSMPDTLFSNSIDISVTSVLPADMQDINDIKDAVRFPNFKPLIVGALLLIIAAIGYAAYHFVKKLRKAKAFARPLPPPWVEAFLALERIPVEDWLARGMIKKYYYALSEILKRYLERRFEFSAAEQTTTEIVDNLRILRVPQRDEFNRFFTRADMVKYAKYVPPGNEITSAIEKAKDLVSKTKPEDTILEKK